MADTLPPSAPLTATLTTPPTTVTAADEWFTLAAPHGARLLCRAAVARADAASARLEQRDPGADAALIDALRELRATIEAYSAVLVELSPQVTSRRCAALVRLLTSPAAAPPGSDTVTVRRVRERWGAIAAPLRPALESWRERHSLDGSRRSTPFAVAAADALQRTTERAARRTRSAEAGRGAERSAQVAAHALSVVLAPLAAATPEGIALAALLHTDGAELATWHDAALRDARVAALTSLAASWRALAEPPLEIERKWLLSALPPHARTAPVMELAQGYLPGESLVERIRRVGTAGAVRWVRTVKLGRGIARIEVEEDASESLGEALYALTVGRRVTKRRYTVPEGTHHWEIDEFTDRTLVVAELELGSALENVTLPPWLAPYVVREVTGERAFTNWQLAR